MMSSSFAQSRYHHARRDLRHESDAEDEQLEEEEETTSLSSSHPTSTGILLFAPPTHPPPPPSSISSSSSSSNHHNQNDWSLINASNTEAAFLRRGQPGQPTRPSLSHATTTSISSGTSSSASPSSFNRSLFPSHDGNGIFLADDDDSSLGLSDDPPSVYPSVGSGTSGEEEEEETRSLPSTTSTNEENVFWGRGSTISLEDDSDHARLRNFPIDSVGGSWALTEAALSTIPDADYPISFKNKPESVGLTSSDSSEDESFYAGSGGGGVTSGGGGHAISIRRRRGKDGFRSSGKGSGDDEDELENTPLAASAGLGLAMMRGARYPTPPPESSLAGEKKKRRHRKSGRLGESSKKSNSSYGGSSKGVVAPSTTRRRNSPSSSAGSRGRTSLPPSTLPPSSSSQPLPSNTKENLFLGSLVTKLLDVDSTTLALLNSTPSEIEATLPTPTPSRSTSPAPPAIRYASRRLQPLTPNTKTRRFSSSQHAYNQAVASRGLAALGRRARFEIDGDDGQYSKFLVGSYEDMEVDDSGDETETERRGYKEYRSSSESSYVSGISPLFASSPLPPPSLFLDESISLSTPSHSIIHSSTATLSPAHRSKSLTSLPTQSLTLSLSASQPFSMTSSTATTRPTPPILRRTSSFSSERESETGRREKKEGLREPWGGELEGLEAAVSYWRRILRSIRGF